MAVLAPMIRIPLFTQAELAEAFSLVLPQDSATVCAGEWFDRFADEDEIDESGRYLYEAPDPGNAPIQAVVSPANGSEESKANSLRWTESFRGMSNESLAENLLLGFVGLHLDLLLLTSPEMFDRVRRAKGWSLRLAESRREQIRKLVEGVRPEGPIPS